MSHSMGTRAGRTRASGAYVRLAVMGALSFASMYVLMYAMVDRLDNVIPNRNQAYMAGLMTAPMLLFELLLMGSMYARVRVNAAIAIFSATMLVMLWLLIRHQVGIGDEQFLKSMIPHHSGAILMCEAARLHDPELTRLCETIVSSQREEIEIMRAKLRNERTASNARCGPSSLVRRARAVASPCCDNGAVDD